MLEKNCHFIYRSKQDIARKKPKIIKAAPAQVIGDEDDKESDEEKDSDDETTNQEFCTVPTRLNDDADDEAESETPLV